MGGVGEQMSYSQEPSEQSRGYKNLYRAHLWTVKTVLDEGKSGFFKVRCAHLKELHKIITEDTLRRKEEEGEFRRRDVVIKNSKHKPPPHQEVPPLMEEFFHILNEGAPQWGHPLLGAYALWRINWIHPFIEGNGRTARQFCYFVMCMKLGHPFEGKQTVAYQLREPNNYRAYLKGIKAADEGHRQSGRPDLSLLEKLLTDTLIKQLSEGIR